MGVWPVALSPCFSPSAKGFFIGQFLCIFFSSKISWSYYSIVRNKTWLSSKLILTILTNMSTSYVFTKYLLTGWWYFTEIFNRGRIFQSFGTQYWCFNFILSFNFWIDNLFMSFKIQKIIGFYSGNPHLHPCHQPPISLCKRQPILYIPCILSYTFLVYSA